MHEHPQQELSNAKDILGSEFRKGISEQGLRRMGMAALRLAKAGVRPSLAFVLGKVCLGLAAEWEGRPVTVAEAEAIEELLYPVFDKSIEAMRVRPDDSDLKILDQLVYIYFQVIGRTDENSLP